MHFNELIRPSVGADLSRTPPIYRPSLAVPLWENNEVQSYLHLVRPAC